MRGNVQWEKILCKRPDDPTATLTVAVSVIEKAVRFHKAVNERHQRDRAAYTLGRAGLCWLAWRRADCCVVSPNFVEATGHVAMSF